MYIQSTFLNYKGLFAEIVVRRGKEFSYSKESNNN